MSSGRLRPKSSKIALSPQKPNISNTTTPCVYNDAKFIEFEICP